MADISTNKNIILANIAKQLAFDLQKISNAKEEWFTAGITLLPIINEPKLLKDLGFTEGATVYFKEQALALNLKESSLQNIQNVMKKLIEFKNSFKNLDLPSAPVANLKEIFANAKKLSTDGKVTAPLVKRAINDALDKGKIQKSEINYVDNITQQLRYAKKIKIKSFDKIDTSDPILLELADTISNLKAGEEQTKAPETKEVAEVKQEKQPAKAESTPAAQPEVTVEKPANETPAVEAPQPAPKAETKEPVATTETMHSSTTDELVSNFLSLNDDSKDFIIKLATSMYGDQQLALLKALSESNQKLLLETISLIKK